MLKVPAKEINRSIQQNEQDKIIDNNMMVPRSTPTRFTFALDGNIVFQQVRYHPRSGSRTMNGSRIKVGITCDFQPGLNSSKFFKVEIISTGRPVAQLNHTTRRDSDSLFSHCSGCCFFDCRQLSLLRQSTGVCEQNTFSQTDAHIVSAQNIALIPCTTSAAQGNLDCVPKIVFVFCAVSHAIHSTLSTPSSTSPLITCSEPCADPREPRGDGFTDPEPRTGYEHRRIVDNPTITVQEIGALY